MLQQFLHWIEKTDQNKLVAGLVLLLAGIILRDLLPYAVRQFLSLSRWVGKKLGGRLSYRYIEKSYLNWVVTELRELKLAGIVGADAAKKPKLEQVFVSLRVGEQEGRSSVVEGALAIGDEIERHGGRVQKSIVRGFKHDLEQASPAERKDAEGILVSHLKKTKKNRFLRTLSWLRRSKDEVIPDEILLQQFLASENLKTGTSSDYASMLLHRTLNNNSRLAMLGAPGAGKTTLLQYVGLAYAKSYAGEKKLRERGCHKRRLAAAKWRLPIFIPLGTIAKRLAEAPPEGKPPSIIDSISLTLPPDLEGDVRNFFFSRLKRGKCVVLLDGLDEVPTDEEFRAVVRAIESLAVNFPRNQFIVSSRVAGWRTGIQADFKVTYVGDLTDDQVEFFVDTWCSAIELNSVVGNIQDESRTDKIDRERRARKRATQLKTALRENPGIRQLATNPMLLSIIALVHHTRASLPQDRSKLYADCSKILLEQWDMVRGLHVDDTNLRFDQKEAIMRRLAFALHTGEIGKTGGGREAARDEVEKLVSDQLPVLGVEAQSAGHLLQILTDRSGLLLERRRGILAFAHLTFQEYFTARYLSRGDRDEHRNFLLQEERVSSDWWRETILLYSGMLNDSSEFIRSLRDSGATDMLKLRTRLCGWCLGEAVQVRQPHVRQQVAEDLLRICTRQSVVKAASLPSEAIGYLIRWSKGEEWHPSAIVSSVRAASAAEQAAMAAAISEMLQSSQIELISAALKAIPSLPSALRERVSARILPLMSHSNSEISRLAIATVRALDAGTIAMTATKLLGEQPTELQVILALRLCKQLGVGLNDHEALVRRLIDFSGKRSPSWQVRQEIAEIFPSIAVKAPPELITTFFTLVSDGDSDVRREATKSLKAMLRTDPNSAVIENTLQLLKQPDQVSRLTAATALGELPHEIIKERNIVGELVALMQDKVEDVSTTAAQVLQTLLEDRLLAPGIESLCLAALQNPERSYGAISVLARTKVPQNLDRLEDPLLRALQSRNHRLRREAAAAVGAMEMGKRPASEHIALRLLDLAEDRNRGVRASAILSLALSQSGNPSVQLIRILQAGLDDRHDSIRTACCQAVGILKRRNGEFAGKLLEILKKKPTGSGFLWRSLTQRRLRLEGYTFSDFIDYPNLNDEVNYWKAAAASLSRIDLSQPAEVISALGEMAMDTERALILPYLADAISKIGAKQAPAKALSTILTIARDFGDRQLRGQSAEWLTGTLFLFGTAYLWRPRMIDLRAKLLFVCKRLPAKEVIPLFKAALEENLLGPRLLVLQAVEELGQSVFSELYPYILKHVTDEEEQTRTMAWKIIKTVNVKRGLWETDPALYASENQAPPRETETAYQP